MPTKKDEEFFETAKASSNGWDEFSSESIKRASDIYPEFKPWLNKEYRIKLLTLPRKVKTTIGESWVVDVFVEGARRSLWATGSFRFHLQKIRDNLKISNDELVGREYIVQKTKGIYEKTGEETTFLSLILIQ